MSHCRAKQSDVWDSESTDTTYMRCLLPYSVQGHFGGIWCTCDFFPKLLISKYYSYSYDCFSLKLFIDVPSDSLQKFWILEITFLWHFEILAKKKKRFMDLDSLDNSRNIWYLKHYACFIRYMCNISKFTSSGTLAKFKGVVKTCDMPSCEAQISQRHHSAIAVRLVCRRTM